MSTEEDTNPYDLLQLQSEATEQEIRTAYRKISLKVHPDRNPNNPEAARLFHELNQAYELLLDPLRRLALDAKLRVKRARAERFKSYDSKRKNLLEELEERERAFKKARVDKHQDEINMQRATERIKEEGRKLREQKENELRQRGQAQASAAKEDQEEDLNVPPDLHALDTTVRVKYSLKSHPNLTTTESIAELLGSFGDVDTASIVLSLKAPKKYPDKPPRNGTALVPFKQIGDAFAAVCASGREERGLDGIDIAWVSGKEPQILGWLKKMGKLGSPPPEPETIKAELPQNQSTGSGSQFSTFPSTFPEAPVDYETVTLMRLREAERRRLESEIES